MLVHVHDSQNHGRRPRGTGGGGDRSPANFSAFNIMPMDDAWKESTSNGSRPPPQLLRRGAALGQNSDLEKFGWGCEIAKTNR